MNSPTGFVNVIVHGLFFMWLNPDGYLELIAPNVDTSTALPHHLVGGVREDLREYTGTVKDWRQVGLDHAPVPPLVRGQIPAGVGTSILQFSVTTLNLGGWDPDPKKYAGRFLLPWPSQFFSVRCDYFNRAFLHNGKNVATEIVNRCNGHDPNSYVGLFTGLRYGYTGTVAIPSWQDGRNIHCYFEPCKKHWATDVNSDLERAGECFLQSNFDLRIGQAADTIFSQRGWNGAGAPSDLCPDDDLSLTEDPNAIQQGICPRLAAPEALRRVSKKMQAHQENVNPANCPNMFVGP